MNGRRVGAIVRAVRLHEGLRQQDVADRAEVSQRWVSELERGRVGSASVDAVERVCRALDILVNFDLRWRGGDLDRLVDRDHAAIVNYLVGRLKRWGWDVRVEYGFNHYGDRGSVDILAWHPRERVLLIVEVKSRLTDLQQMLGSLDRKVRVVPRAFAIDKPFAADGRPPTRTDVLLVVLGTTANRNVVARHPDIFDSAFPDRSPGLVVRLRRPVRPLRALWFVSSGAVGAGLRRQRCRRGMRAGSIR
jgi:transcriptional regulator with XRE-family HTH domain